MAATDATTLSLERTPTWALATVCFVFIFTSIVLEHLIHLLTNWLRRHRKTALSDAVDRLKSELMLLGFISLMLAVTQEPISKICIPAKLADTMLPCLKEASQAITVQNLEHLNRASNFTRNLSVDHNVYNSILSIQLRQLAEGEQDEDEDTSANGDQGGSGGAAASDPCTSKGKVSLITQDGIQQLHIFIFVLAVMQIVYSVLTFGLGRAKMRRWKTWEKETQTTEYEVANDPNRFRFTRQTTFGRRHMTNFTETSAHLWIKCFFRQFFNSVAKVDYMTLRHGFISAHLSTKHNNFNFQKYIERSLDEDFKVVVGISPFMWFLVVIFLLVDVRGWNVYLWVSYVPLLFVLVLGAKLEVIVARMALQIKEKNSVIIGTPLVRPNDDLFWFKHPSFVLVLLHYTLFVNAFELAFFIWVTIEFGFDSCYHEHTAIIITRVVLAVTVQVLCSYITLPLYALVTQMGSHFKSRVLEDQVANIIKQWHGEVRERRKMQEQSIQTLRTSLSTEWSSRNGSPAVECSRPTLQDIIYSSKEGEITEVEENAVRDDNDSSGGRSRVVIQQMHNTIRRE